MNTLSINVRYRPLRIGWCVLDGDLAAIRKAMRMSFAFWGGMYNPIIPVDRSPLAEHLVKAFRIDVLWPVTRDAKVTDFINNYKHLPSPFFHEELFLKYDGINMEAQVLDILHPIQRMYDEHFKNNQSPEGQIELYRWRDDDNLADVFLATYGGVPSPSQTGTDYVGHIEKSLRPTIIEISDQLIVPVPSKKAATLSTFSTAYIGRHYSVQNHWEYPGFYIGSARNSADLVNFWNLRAADIWVMFFDPEFGERLSHRRDARLEQLRARPPNRHEQPERIAIWSGGELSQQEAAAFGEGLTLVTMRDGLWNGLNIRPPVMYFSQEGALASVDNSDQRRPTISFLLPKKPVSEGHGIARQHLVVSIDTGIGLYDNDVATLHAPFLPFLNEYYGRECFFDWNMARTEPENLSRIIDTSTDSITLRSLNVFDLIKSIFSHYGIVVKPSKPGLIADRLIRQMGGLAGCRVFKIAGVRRLIEEHNPSQSFTRGHATRTILGEGSDRPMSLYRDLYIEPRPGRPELTTDAAFSYLLRSGIFRAGLRFECPNCQLEFWISIDDVRSSTICEYCGGVFNVTPLLKDRDWAYRRSGLFGRDDHQEGAIPVVLLLQQLNTVLHREGIYTTAALLESTQKKFSACETDFIFMNSRRGMSNIEVAVGECKTAGEITDDDVQKMESTISQLPRDIFDPYIVFAKLTKFNAEEIERLRSLYERSDRRVIMLTSDELEPYYPYDRRRTEPSRYLATSLNDMARHTWTIFLEKDSSSDDARAPEVTEEPVPTDLGSGRRRKRASRRAPNGR